MRLAVKWSSRPNKARVCKSLNDLYSAILGGNTKRGVLVSFDVQQDRFIIFSDQHKGAKNTADDFWVAEKNYLAALDFYCRHDYFLINLGDCEELWKNTIDTVRKNNTASFDKEKMFLQKQKFLKIFGNHDLYWGNDFLTAPAMLEKIYGQALSVYEGAILQTNINNCSFQVLLTHGHQGDLQSDGNRFSKWFVSNVWARLQAYLHIYPDTPAYDTQLKTAHNTMMYEWSSEQDIALITGHTHQPVFQSLTLLERLYNRLSEAIKAKDTEKVADIQARIRHRFALGEVLPDFTGFKPNYFNSGCCCYSDGDITGIEIVGGQIRLIKWEYDSSGMPQRVLLEEATLGKLASDAKTAIV